MNEKLELLIMTVVVLKVLEMFLFPCKGAHHTGPISHRQILN